MTSPSRTAPQGIAALTDTTDVELDLANLDSFSAAQFAAEGAGASLTAFLVSPDDALTLAKLKVSTGSNETLMQGQRVINGIPIIVAPSLAAGTIYGVDASRIYSVIREDVRVDVDASVYFTSDRLAVRTTMRLGFGFADPASIIKLTSAA